MKLDAVSGRQIARSFKQHPSASLTAALFLSFSLHRDIAPFRHTARENPRLRIPVDPTQLPQGRRTLTWPLPSGSKMVIILAWWRSSSLNSNVSWKWFSKQRQLKWVLWVEEKDLSTAPTPSVCHLIFTNLCPPKVQFSHLDTGLKFSPLSERHEESLNLWCLFFTPEASKSKGSRLRLLRWKFLGALFIESYHAVVNLRSQGANANALKDVMAR